MKTAIFVAVLVAATGCAPTPVAGPLRIYVADGVSQTAVLAGAQMWREFADSSIVQTEAESNVTVRSADYPCANLYALDHDFGSVTIAVKCFPRQDVDHDFDWVMVRQASAHELGHAMGLWHTDDGFAVMNTFVDPDTDPPAGITDVDRAEYRRTH